ncbi:uncharacterized protein LOC114539447 [Dendronephthya gigantea]|uniref:uncharacterized protein LOC114539447 n=1 Tax=Dendronephthya gigantea TaxID=151771 RepID=UPI00106AA3B6|nr:uncharacterized protein LOC114539447 [Dendronephthya gigantea]XP_028415877.1 uncharacterized protein LOC114539447 [Dendronephthya gigantea]
MALSLKLGQFGSSLIVLYFMRKPKLSYLYFSLAADSNVEATPAFVWWLKEPLIFSSGSTANSVGDLGGILPEIWQQVVDSCKPIISADEFNILKHGRTLQELSPLSRVEFSEKLSGKSLLMPVKLRKEKESLLGMSFVKLIDSPGVAVLIKKTLTGTGLLNAILLAWPILIFVVLSACLSGFVIWLLECRSNPQMFDPFCPKGVLNGFWWAAVTMTTVGYGDIAPKTVLGRLFTILWISAGLVILAMYMGVVTTSLTTTRLEGTQHFYGIKVSAANQTEEEKFAILHNTQLQVEKNERAVIDAVSNNENRVRLGFIDFYVASYYSKLIGQKNLDITRIIPRDRVYGVLLGKDWAPEVIDCLRRYSEDNRDVIHNVIMNYTQVSEPHKGMMEYFAGSVFGYSVFGFLGLLCLFIALGLCFDRGYFNYF